uniref:Putative plasma membrane glycoprotein cd36 n=1 Tax=Corethrella appendiculata TaxID=1370023 RepID=U5EZE5_9DIPT
MCSKCTDFQKKIWIFGCSTFFFLTALILGLLWPLISSNMLVKKLSLTPDSTNYKNWIRTPIPMYLELYLFNWTNADQVENYTIVKPNFQQLGPYTFKEVHERTKLIWNDNNTITFNQRRIWNFVPELSNGTLDDEVTNLNIITLIATDYLKNAPAWEKFIINGFLKMSSSFLWEHKKVRQLLFDGLNDRLLNLLRTIQNSSINIPFDKFGYFYNRNLSETYDGIFTMNTGVDDLNKLGELTLWNGKKNTGMYPGKCGNVYGTTGELWPATHENKTNITVFATDVCRSVTLQYDSPLELFEITGKKYIGDDRVFDNGVKYPEQSCYCTSDKCPSLAPGVFNVSQCKFGSPMFVSFPHFYLADESYLNKLTGLKPNKSEHEFYIALEPKTGIPLDIRAQLQINLKLEPIEGYKFYEKVPNMMVPMIWFRQRAQLTSELADQAKIALILPSVGTYIAVLFGLIAIVISIVSIIIFLKRYHQTNVYEELQE